MDDQKDFLIEIERDLDELILRIKNMGEEDLHIPVKTIS